MAINESSLPFWTISPEIRESKSGDDAKHWDRQIGLYFQELRGLRKSVLVYCQNEANTHHGETF